MNEIKGVVLGPLLGAILGYMIFGPAGAIVGFFGPVVLIGVLLYGNFQQATKPKRHCEYCETAISSTARACPHCGRTQQYRAA